MYNNHENIKNLSVSLETGNTVPRNGSDVKHRIVVKIVRDDFQYSCSLNTISTANNECNSHKDVSENNNYHDISREYLSDDELDTFFLDKLNSITECTEALNKDPIYEEDNIISSDVESNNITSEEHQIDIEEFKIESLISNITSETINIKQEKDSSDLFNSPLGPQPTFSSKEVLSGLKRHTKCDIISSKKCDKSSDKTQKSHSESKRHRSEHKSHDQRKKNYVDYRTTRSESIKVQSKQSSSSGDERNNSKSESESEKDSLDLLSPLGLQPMFSSGEMLSGSKHHTKPDVVSSKKCDKSSNKTQKSHSGSKHHRSEHKNRNHRKKNDVDYRTTRSESLKVQSKPSSSSDDKLKNSSKSESEEIHKSLTVLDEPECTKCHKKFASKTILNSHIKSVHKIKYQCHYCAKRFDNKQKFEEHKLLHTKKLKCNICNKEFISRSVLKKHQELHKEDELFKCNICMKKFKDEQHLKVHKGKVHTKCFQCTVCNKKFDYKHVLQRHELTHGGEKPFKCSTCGERFFRSDALKVHQTREHTELKPFCCDLCTKSFDYAHVLKRHKKNTHRAAKKR